LLTLT